MRRVLAVMLGIIVLSAAAASFAGVCGDVNGDEKLNLSDISSIVNFLYRGGPVLNCGTSFTSICGDFNADGRVNLLDVARILDDVYRGGPAMICQEWGEVTDIDGNVYRTVKIGDQWWMAENLKVTHYRNGDEILHVTDGATWQSFWTATGTPAYCEYDNDPNNIATYGCLYNWYAVEDSRNIAPAGWHVPSSDEWHILIECLGDSTTGGGKMKEAGTTHWSDPNSGATNRSGFSVLPAGARPRSSGNYEFMYYNTYFWSSTANFTYSAWFASVEHDFSAVYNFTGIKADGYSIRCVKDQ